MGAFSSPRTWIRSLLDGFAYGFLAELFYDIFRLSAGHVNDCVYLSSD